MLKDVLKLIAFFSVMGLSSCAPTMYQLNELKKNKDQDRLVYRNEDVRVKFNTWGEGGEYYFIVKNMRKDSFIWVDKNNSNIVINGESQSYFGNISVKKKHYKENYGDYFDRGMSYEVSKEEKRYVPIPPNSFKVFALGKIKDSKIAEFEGTKPNELKGKEKVYSKNASPLIVKNFLYYYTDKDYENDGVLSGEFFLSNIKMVDEEKFNNISEYKTRTKNKFYFERSAASSAGAYILLGGAAAVTIFLAVSAGES